MRGIGDVADDGHHARQARDGVEEIRAAGVDDDVPAVAGEMLGEGQPEPAGCSGDQGDGAIVAHTDQRVT